MPKDPLPSRFSIRVYGILIDERQRVLLSREKIDDFAFSKFPGGGLEFGEGPREGLMREFIEETGLEIETGKHVYTADFYIQSKLDPRYQVIGIYYLVKPKNENDLKNIPAGSIFHPFHETQNEISLEWIPLEEFSSAMLTFEMDKRAWQEFMGIAQEL